MELSSRRRWMVLSSNGWVRLESSWKFALGVFFAARAWFFIWPLVVSAAVPVVVQNLDLFGSPVVAAFDLSSSGRYVYSRQVDGAVLSFRAAQRGFLTDMQTGSMWALDNRQAQAGPSLSRMLEPSLYTVEDVFPYHGVAADPNPSFALWQRFDANWYLKIAERGYSSLDGSTVYFPLFPIGIRFLGDLLFGRDLLAGLLISNLALIVALYFLHRIAKGLIGESGARRALVYLAIFPTSFFLFAPYTESLFLCLSLASLFAGQRGRWLVAGGLGALAALTRFQGVMLALPLANMWWTGQGKTVLSRVTTDLTFRGIIRKSRLAVLDSSFLSLLLIPIATACYLVATNLSLLTSYEGPLHARFVLPWDNLLGSIVQISQGGASTVDLLNLAATITFAVMCVAVLVELPHAYGIYTVSMFAAPLFRMTTQQPLVSMTRYVLVLFPVFLVLAAWGRNQWVNRAVIYLSLPLNLYLSAQFFVWGWVG